MLQDRHTRKLIEVLREAREYLGRPGNCFDWSSWENADDAIAEIDALIHELESGKLPDKLHLQVLFAPTGDIQETSLSSGWGTEFLKLSIKFDKALAGAYPVPLKLKLLKLFKLGRKAMQHKGLN